MYKRVLKYFSFLAAPWLPDSVALASVQCARVITCNHAELDAAQVYVPQNVLGACA